MKVLRRYSIVKMSTLFMVLAFLVSCASSYRPILPEKMAYEGKQSSEGISYAYRYNVLSETGNKKYAKKEGKNGVKLIAIEIENNSDREIILREHAKFYTGDKIIFPMDPKQIQQQIKQPAGLYMLWSLLWVVITKCENEDCSSIPLPVGLVIGIGNTSAASSANKKLLVELMANNILDRKIAPGEMATGLIGISAEQTQPIRIELTR